MAQVARLLTLAEIEIGPAAPSSPGARRCLTACFAEPAERFDAGCARTLRLETNRNPAEAIALYRSCGYRGVDPFNDEPYARHRFEKTV